MEQQSTWAEGRETRRSIMIRGAAVGVGATAAGRLLVDPPLAVAKGGLTEGDAAIFLFLAAAEIIEADPWQQSTSCWYPGQRSPGWHREPGLYQGVPSWTRTSTSTSTTTPTTSSATPLHQRLPESAREANGQPGPVPHPAEQPGGRRPAELKRLTNLMQLTVNTSFWTRYRSDTQNPDLGDTLPQAVPGLAVGQHPGIPRNNGDLTPGDHLQAIANTAGFHFAWVEQGGTSLYAGLAQRVTHTEVLRVLLSIGGSEIMHFQTWQDKAGNAPALTDPTTGLVFPDLNADGELTQTNLIMPEPTPVPEPEVPAGLHHPPHPDGGGSDGRGQGLHRRRAVYRPVAGVLCRPTRPGEGGRRGPTRGSRPLAR